MRCIDVDKFVKETTEAKDRIFLKEMDNYPTEEEEASLIAYWRGINVILSMLKDSEYVFEVNEIAKDVTYPRGCDEVDIDCKDCEHHRSTQWCARAIENVKEANPVYEEGWMDGVDAAAKNLDGYTSGYADGWDDGWTECLESIRIAMKKVLEDNK